MLKVSLVGDAELLARFNVMPTKMHARILRGMTSLALQLENYIKTQKLSGQVLNKITGKLQSSIHNEVTDTGQTITARVYSSGVPYAAAQEYGAIIPDRYPVNAKAMHWKDKSGKDIFAKFARGFTLPSRSYMRSGLTDFKPTIVSELQKAVSEGAQT